MLVHPGTAWDDISRVQRLGRQGWLGFEDDPPTPLAFGERLWEALGPFVLASVVLAATGYVSSSADEVAVQPETAIDAIVAAFSYLPVLIVLLSIPFLLRYRLDLPTTESEAQ